MNADKRKQIIELVHKEVVPALGCTEPIAVALAVAKAREAIGCCPTKTVVAVSANIFKNGMGVGVPGTGMVGLGIAAALAVISGDSADKLEVLKHVSPELVASAKKIVDNKEVIIELEPTDEKLFIRAACYNGENKSEVIIRGSHANIISVKLNDEVLFLKDENQESAIDPMNSIELSLDEVFEFAHTAPLEEIEFILEGAEMNKILSKAGLDGKLGLGIGANIQNKINERKVCDELMNQAMAMTAAASDARMAGAMLPAMSNSGSGNQGITAMLPVVSIAESLGSTREQLIRALMLSNLVVIFIKRSFGRLSAACGCVIASTGAACGATYLLGGTQEQVEYSIKNMIGNLTGMVCDGAKLGCALKVATGTSAAIQSAFFAIDNICISANDGIIENDTEKTIRNVAKIASEAMNETDKAILNIMVNK